MLKRFMNWLLNKWQGLFGTLGGKHKASAQFLSDRAAQSGKPVDRSDNAIPVAARTPYTPPTESLLKPVIEPVAPVANRPAVLPKIIKPDTHQRIDVTPAALTDSVKPVFPTEVSALMGSPLQPGEGSDLPFRTLKKIPESQLPAIHDLLPATEATELDEQPETRLSNQSVNQAANQAAFLENDLPEDAPLTESSYGYTESESPLELSTHEIADGSLSEPLNKSASTSDQVVLFSFDIVESDTTGDSIQLESDVAVESLQVAENPVDGSWEDAQSTDESTSYDYTSAEENNYELITDEPLVNEDHLDNEPSGVYQTAIDKDFETSENLLDTDSISNESESLLAQQTIHSEFFPELLSEDSVSENLGDTGLGNVELGNVELENVEIKGVEPPVDTSVDTSAEPAERPQTGVLPYPWSLPVSDLSLQGGEKEIFSSDEAVSDNVRPAKNGIVKLLFTLKAGNFHGYIAPDDGTQDILFHQKYINADIFSQLDRGIKVSVLVKYIEGKAYATHIDLL